MFFGDSITQAGVEPGGYISRLNEMLKQSGKADNYELVGAGVSGNKIYDLYLRMEDDVLKLRPDVVVIWVGVNDVCQTNNPWAQVPMLISLRNSITQL